MTSTIRSRPEHLGSNSIFSFSVLVLTCDFAFIKNLSKVILSNYSVSSSIAVSDEVWRLIVLVYCLSSRCTSNMLKSSFDRVLVGQVVLVKASGTVPRDDIMTRDMLLLAGLICSRGAGEQGHRVRWFKITESISNIRNMQGEKSLSASLYFPEVKKLKLWNSSS